MNYTVLAESTRASIIQTVNDYIKDGWTPIGGVVVLKVNNTYTYYQTMIFGNRTTS